MCEQVNVCVFCVCVCFACVWMCVYVCVYVDLCVVVCVCVCVKGLVTGVYFISGGLHTFVQACIPWQMIAQ